jgi:circadian clock protein KaiB
MSQRKKQQSLNRFKLRLYVAGENELSLRAKRNLEKICKDHLRLSYELEIIDIIEEPRCALDDGVVVTPTLLKSAPPPEVKVAGDLSDLESILVALGLKSE